jgi:hypothetical protein
MEGLPESVLIRERFGELFEAAQMLLRGGVTQEERVIPTLAFANCVQVVRSLAAEKEQLVAAWEDPEAWEHEVEIFSWKHASLEPVRVVEGILVLERRPVYVDIHTPVYVGEWDAKPTAKERAKLLNEHVLRDTWKALPEEDCSSSQTNQLWRDARRFGERLLAASHPLYLSEPGWILSHNRFSLKKLF